ncbi:MAG TPA: hypothetical protein VGK51_13935 [Actinomycetota bacterium]
MTAALSVSGFLGTTPAAHAGGNSSATCSDIGINVVCIGTLGINNNTIEIDVLNVDINHLVDVKNALNNNEVNILNNVLSPDIQTEVNNVASGNVVVVKNLVNVCQVKVIELGVINNNIAKCG